VGALGERVHPGDIVLLDVADLTPADAASLIAAAPAAVLDVSAVVSPRGNGDGLRLLLSSGVAVLDQVGTGIWSSVTDGDELHVDLRSGELRSPDGRLAGLGVVTCLADLPEGSAPPLEQDRTVQLLHDAATALSAGQETPSGAQHRAVELDGVLDGVLEVLDLLGAADRPILIVGAATTPEQVTALRSWVALHTPVVICVDGAAALWTGSRRRRVPDVIVCRDPAELGRPRELSRVHCIIGPPEVAERSLTLGLPTATLHGPTTSLVTALRLARCSATPVVVTVGIPLAVSDLLGLPREAAADVLCELVQLAGRLVPAAAGGLARVRHGWGLTTLVGAAGSAAAVAVLALSDPGLALIHRLDPGLHPW
jgi:uncharacterized membrane-anchored protein